MELLLLNLSAARTAVFVLMMEFFDTIRPACMSAKAHATFKVFQFEGVIGEQPVIRAGQPYDYVSGCPLSTPSGSMVGSYGMIGEDGSRFDVAIPQFSLAAPVVAR